MRDSDWNKIKEKFTELCDEVEPSDLVSKLYQHSVFTDDDRERITSQKTRRDKVDTLLHILHRKELPDEDVYTVFLNDLRTTQPHIADELKPPGKARKPLVVSTESSKGKNVDFIQNLDVEGLCNFLKPILEKHKITDTDKVLEYFRKERITGRVLLNTSVSELRDICPLLKHGDRVNIILDRDDFIQQKLSHEEVSRDGSNEVEGGLQRREYARKFDTNAGYTEKYKKGKILENLQTCVGVFTDPIHFCISIGDRIDVDSALETIGWETVKFSAACMNDRTNGTLHFGVYDGSDGNHVHGEIAGLTAVEQRDCEKAISSWVLKSFPSDKYATATSCIRPPQYIDVISNNECIGFVLEVDIEPKASLVKDEVYYVIDQYIQKSKKEPKEPKQHLFRLKSGIPHSQDVQGIMRFTETKTKLTEQRKDAEMALSARSRQSSSLLQQLQDALCDGDTKMGDVYPVLVINATDRIASIEELHSKFSFIADINWVSIFDFDPIGSRSGIYNYLVKKHDKEFKIKLTDDFDQRSHDHPQMKVNDDKLQQEMDSSNLQPWIFCNGYEPMGKLKLGVLEWKKQRSEGFKEAVRYFSYQIPRDRAKIIYLLLSKDYDVMLEAVEELSLKFQNQWIVLAERETVTAQWQEKLISRNVVEKKYLESHLVTGNKWEDISTCIKEITRSPHEELSNDECSLITSLGKFIQLPRNIQNRLCDLEILSGTECIQLETLSEDEKHNVAKDHETKFYQGQPPSWVNFYHGFHVLRRKNHDDLMKNVDRVLNGDVPDNENIGNVIIYHQPGSGGTTTAKQVLWDWKEKIRCCTLKSYSKESHNQITELWKYGEDVTAARPVLVMIDNLDEDKLQDLTESLQGEANTHFQGLSRVMCVLLICHRHSSLPVQKKKRTKFVLRQELHPEETNWFQSKYDDLVDSFKRQKGPDPKHLLSLNIMKENFNERYIENTVREILRDVKKPEERKLLKYVSLLKAYDQQSRGIPVPCFDPLMTNMGKLSGQKWELGLSAPTNMILTRSTSPKSQRSSLQLINPLLCKWVLDNLINAEQQSLSDAVLEYLNSDCCRYRYDDMAFQQLLSILRDIMKHREMLSSGKRSTFSRLIEELYDSKNVDSAAEILELMFEKTCDPFIAQQLARLYILCENWHKATHYASEATSLKQENSYLWDTHGQIFKFRLAKLFETGVTSDIEKNKRLMQEAIECAFEGTCRFTKVQEITCSTPSTEPNTAGYFGEIDICISLLDTLSLIPQFRKKSEMQKFLNGKSDMPEELALLTQKQLAWLKALQGNVFITLRKLEDEAQRYKSDQMNERFRSSSFLSTGNLHRLRQTLGSYFGDDDVPSLENAQSSSPDKRRRQVRRLGVTSLQSILKLAKEDRGKEKIIIMFRLTQLNCGHVDRLPYDCRINLGSAIALLQIFQSPTDLPNYEYLLQTSKTLYNMKHEGQYIDLEPYLYFVLLHWPMPNRRQFKSLVSQEILQNALVKWNEAHINKYSHRKQNSFTVKERPFLFLTNKVGIESIIHIDQLKNNRLGTNRSFGSFQLGKVLETRENRLLLQRFDGMLSGNGWEVSVRLVTQQGNKVTLQIPLYTREARQSMSNKKVYFVLGFGWSGPTACDVLNEPLKQEVATPNTRGNSMQTPTRQISMTADDLFQGITNEFLIVEEHLRHIANLKTFPWNTLRQDQKMLVKKEGHLRNTRDHLYQKRHDELLMGFP